jgi:hypothetical protein
MFCYILGFACIVSILPSRTSISADYVAVLDPIDLNAIVGRWIINLDAVLIGGQPTDPHGKS